MDSLDAGIIDLVQNWMLESHYRGREIYKVCINGEFLKEQILDGSHSLPESAVEEIQLLLVHSVCRAASAISVTLRHLFNDTWFQVFIV